MRRTLINICCLGALAALPFSGMIHAAVAGEMRISQGVSSVVIAETATAIE